MEIHVAAKQREYNIIIERGALSRAGEEIAVLAGPSSRCFIITDSGVPDVWRELLQSQLPGAPMHVFPQGEASKCMTVYEELLTWLAENRASRKDIIVALGGGVVGDLAGFTAASYMRGIRYVNIPTTSLSQVDSSIGGKTAIDLGGIKNIVGAFWQPSLVIIDPDTLETLSARELSNGLAEAVKSGLIRDPELFAIFEENDWRDRLDEIIYRSIMVKKAIVEEDENETGVRKMLNFGHTYGHAYETLAGGRYIHGECVSAGMMTILRDPDIRARLAEVLRRLYLPADPVEFIEEFTSAENAADAVTGIITNDKKAAGRSIDIAEVDEIGNGHIETWSIDQIRDHLQNIL